MSTLTAGITWEKALELLKQYNTEAFHIRHGLTVEAVMGWMAEELGHGEDREFWALTGLLHDVDFEKWPEEHCVKAPALLRESPGAAHRRRLYPGADPRRLRPRLGHDGHRLQARA